MESVQRVEGVIMVHVDLYHEMYPGRAHFGAGTASFFPDDFCGTREEIVDLIRVRVREAEIAANTLYTSRMACFTNHASARLQRHGPPLKDVTPTH